jgi:hypothetical protein
MGFNSGLKGLMKAYQVVNSSKQKQSGIKEAIMLDSM